MPKLLGPDEQVPAEAAAHRSRRPARPTLEVAVDQLVVDCMNDAARALRRQRGHVELDVPAACPHCGGAVTSTLHRWSPSTPGGDDWNEGFVIACKRCDYKALIPEIWPDRKDMTLAQYLWGTGGYPWLSDISSLQRFAKSHEAHVEIPFEATRRHCLRHGLDPVLIREVAQEVGLIEDIDIVTVEEVAMIDVAIDCIVKARGPQ